MAQTLFDRAEWLAKQRAHLLPYANDPAHAKRRRSILLQARRIERVIVDIAELALYECRKELK